MNCPTCPRPGLACLGERIPHLCRKRNYRAYLRGYDPTAPDPEPAPSLLEQAGSLARAVAAHVADGGRIASAEVQAERQAICRSCEHHEPAKDICSLCGCLLKIKRTWASSACPDDPPRWGPA